MASLVSKTYFFAAVYSSFRYVPPIRPLCLIDQLAKRVHEQQLGGRIHFPRAWPVFGLAEVLEDAVVPLFVRPGGPFGNVRCRKLHRPRHDEMCGRGAVGALGFHVRQEKSGEKGGGYRVHLNILFPGPLLAYYH